MTKKYIFLDFEYNNTRNKRLTVVCCSVLSDLGKESFWIHNTNEEYKTHFKKRMEWFRDQGYIFISYNVEAESSAFLSLDINPLGMKWIDLYLEYVMLSNHNNAINKGKQLMDGKIKTLSHWKNEKGNKNLAAALYKLCGIERDTVHKDIMRDLIISAPDKFTDEEQEAIMEYCDTDVEDLPKLLKSINEQYRKYIPKEHLATLKDEAHWRAECSVRTAMISRHGYPIHLQKTINLANNVPVILRECIEDINSQFPDVLPFKWNKAKFTYSMDTKAIRNWIKSQKFKDWDTTETGLYSLALECWEKRFSFRHTFPRGNFGAQIVRYLKIQQSLRSFNIKGGSQNKTFFDYVGDDSMCRPYLGQYVAQSSRFQPASTGYLFLKPAFLRSLCHPPEGYLMGSIDYSSQEFLISALMSGDDKMLEAYKEGDVYLYFAKQSKMVPPDATKDSHKRERDLAKATVLGISYSMTCIGLSRKLTADSGSYVSEEEAQKYIDNFNKVFRKFYNWKERQLELYKAKGYIRLADGFMMFGDNKNDRSVNNMPVQGTGAAILRKAIQLAQDNGVTVVAPLHDSLYIMFPKDDLTAMDILAKSLTEAFCFYFKGLDKEKAKAIRLDSEVWGDDINLDGKYTKLDMPMALEKIHIDSRGKDEYTYFSPYFDNDLNLDLL